MPLPKQTTTFIVKVSKGFPGRNVSMMTDEIKAQALLASPVGCALLLDISHNSHLPLEYFADPMVSFWLLSCAVDWSDIRSELNARELALEHAQDHADLARRIVENPAFAWWYDRLTWRPRCGRRLKCRVSVWCIRKGWKRSIRSPGDTRILAGLCPILRVRAPRLSGAELHLK